MLLELVSLSLSASVLAREGQGQALNSPEPRETGSLSPAQIMLWTNYVEYGVRSIA